MKWKKHILIFLTYFYKIFDEGCLTDGKGRNVDFRNTIIILTSNIGSSYLIQTDLSQEEKEKAVRAELYKYFRPEFINRLDDTIIYQAIQPEALVEIVESQLREILLRAKEKGLIVKVERSVLQWLAKRGYDPQFGARPLKRLLQQSVANLLSQVILKGEYKPGKACKLLIEKDELKIK